MDNIISQRNKKKFSCDGFLYIFDKISTDGSRKYGAASVRTTVAECGYTSVL